MKNFCNGTSKNKKQDRMIFILIFVFIVFWSILFYYSSPKEIVYEIGIENVYVLVFLLAAIGGVSVFTSTGFYVTIITLSAGGANPIYLGLFASIGLTIGDLLFYYFGSKGKKCIPNRYAWGIERVSRYMDNIKDKYIVILIFSYSLTPLPSDVMALSLAVAGFPLKKIIPPLLFGNFTLISVLSALSQIGFKLLI